MINDPATLPRGEILCPKPCPSLIQLWFNHTHTPPHTAPRLCSGHVLPNTSSLLVKQYFQVEIPLPKVSSFLKERQIWNIRAGVLTAKMMCSSLGKAFPQTLAQEVAQHTVPSPSPRQPTPECLGSQVQVVQRSSTWRRTHFHQSCPAFPSMAGFVLFFPSDTF